MHTGLAGLGTVVLVTVISGCATSGRPPAAPPPAAPLISYDGTYGGTIQVTFAGARDVQSNWCDTPPAISLSVRNNAFSYVLAHPNVPQGSSYSLSPTFTVAVAPDGSFDARSVNGEAEMAGRISGGQMAGKINGTACVYAFTAEKS